MGGSSFEVVLLLAASKAAFAFREVVIRNPVDSFASLFARESGRTNIASAAASDGTIHPDSI
jgi:hypothetical protein